MTQLEKLAVVFDAVWERFIEGYELDSIDLENILESAELVERVFITEENVDFAPEGHYVGDNMMGLNHDGKEILAIARGLKTLNYPEMK